MVRSGEQKSKILFEKNGSGQNIFIYSLPVFLKTNWAPQIKYHRDLVSEVTVKEERRKKKEERRRKQKKEDGSRRKKTDAEERR